MMKSEIAPDRGNSSKNVLVQQQEEARHPPPPHPQQQLAVGTRRSTPLSTLRDESVALPNTKSLLSSAPHLYSRRLHDGENTSLFLYTTACLKSYISRTAVTYGHMTTAMHEIECISPIECTPSPAPPLPPLISAVSPQPLVSIITRF